LKANLQHQFRIRYIPLLGSPMRIPNRRSLLRCCGCTLLWGALSGCAVLHTTQVGEIHSPTVLQGKRFEIKVSNIGFDLDTAVAIANAVARQSDHADTVGAAGEIIKLFQTGPRTGNPVFRDDYSDRVFEMLRAECPSGRISGLVSIRETAKYPVVSGEIVKLIGYCAPEEDAP